MKKILLNNAESKINGDKNQFIATKLVGSNKLLPFTDMVSTINAKDLYDTERSSSKSIRLTCNVNTICTNVLFNAFTEIVKNEGSENATCLNFPDAKLDTDTVKALIHKQKQQYFEGENRVYNAIEDTQLSNSACGYDYHCGLDFFNNHRLRSLTFKTVNMLKENDDNSIKNFNTIQDYHRTFKGNIIDDAYVIGDRNLTNSKLHLYTNDNILSFRESFEKNLSEENGWFGFVNKGKIDTFIYNNEDEKTVKLDISKPINNKRSCSFVDMYPTRDLFNFTPKYNSFRHRIEKNWNYCVTYPSASLTENIPFIVDGGLRIFLLDNTESDIFKIYTMTKHGLSEGDYINVYQSGELSLPFLEVSDVIDDYCFYTTKKGNDFDGEWTIYDKEKDDIYFERAKGTSYKIKKDDYELISLTTNFLTFSFKKISEGRELEYYVRQFSKLPNWKYCNTKVDEESVNKNDGELIKTYSSDESKLFESHVSKLAFSKNIYNDSVGKVIFSDTMNINYLQDNNKNYLTNLYFTIIKNNRGYKKWYNENDAQDESVEYSHCFGKISCGFYLSPLMYDEHFTIKTEEGQDGETVMKIKCNLCDAKLINNGSYAPFSGLNVSLINQGYVDDTDDADEINYYKNINFYGDLCAYSVNEAKETIIQNIEYRFNTAQREVCRNWVFKYANIKYDDYDLNQFVDDENDFLDIITQTNNGDLSEGYYYNPHYEICIRSFSNTVTTQYPKTFSIRKKNKNNNYYQITTNSNNFFEKGEYFIIYDREEEKIINAQITSIVAYNIFKCRILDDGVDLEKENYHYRVVKKEKNFPNSARMLLDDTCRFVWRDIYENGFDKSNENGLETYPFSNGCLYINKNINLYLKRQNPTLTSILTNPSYDLFNIKGKFLEDEKKNNYFTPDDIVC